MVKSSPTLGTLVSTKTKCIKLIIIGKITLIPVAFLMALSIEPLLHPPYSPDLAICNFFLFPTVKDHLRGRKFESREELGNAITEALRTVTRDVLQHVGGKMGQVH